MKPQHDRATRERALQLARKVGPTEAAKQLGLRPSTVRSWLHRAGESGPPAGADPQTWVQAKEAGARSAWEIAQVALAKVRELLDAGKTADAQRAALTMAITIDKSALLEAAVAAAQERDIRLAEQQSELIAAVIRSFFEAVDVSLTDASRRVLRQLLAQAGAGEPIVASPADASAARAELREHLAHQLQVELPRDADAEFMSTARGLPAPRPHPDGAAAEDGERGELAKPVRKVQVRQVRKSGDAAMRPAVERPRKRSFRVNLGLEQQRPIRGVDLLAEDDSE